LVLIDFWTYTCINLHPHPPLLEGLGLGCQVQGQGLTIVGVHSPEFKLEKNAGNVLAAIRQETASRYPVVQDNNLANWNAWGKPVTGRRVPDRRARPGSAT